MQLADGFAVQAGEKLWAADVTGGIDEQGKHHVLDNGIDRDPYLTDTNGYQQRAGHTAELKVADLDLADPVADGQRQKQCCHRYLLKKGMQEFHFEPPTVYFTNLEFSLAATTAMAGPALSEC